MYKLEKNSDMTFQFNLIVSAMVSLYVSLSIGNGNILLARERRRSPLVDNRIDIRRRSS